MYYNVSAEKLQCHQGNSSTYKERIGGFILTLFTKAKKAREMDGRALSCAGFYTESQVAQQPGTFFVHEIIYEPLLITWGFASVFLFITASLPYLVACISDHKFLSS